MNTIITKTIFILSSLLILFSCEDSDDKKQINCTKQFQSIPINVQYVDNLPAAIDSYKVMWGDRDITPIKDFTSEEFKLAQKTGQYTIINDNMQPELNGKTISVTVYGYIGYRKVLAEEYKISADDCHVIFVDEKPLLAKIGYICTTEFVSIFIKVQYTDETPVLLDSYKVMWGYRDITENAYQTSNESGIYTILTDRMQPDLFGKNVDITFYGYINNKEVISETYKVGADECHVTYKDEKSRIITLEKP